jgi:hypothetical protein
MVPTPEIPPHALHIDAALFCFARTNLAEAGHVARIDRRLFVRGARGVRKRICPSHAHIIPSISSISSDSL